MDFHSDGNILAAGSFERSLWLYDIRAAEPIGAMNLPQVVYHSCPSLCSTSYHIRYSTVVLSFLYLYDYSSSEGLELC